ncbi:alpha/beta hydrolase [bacterium]|nr:alpha/beta hydrolase [Rubripirellula sp.]MDB4338692.1 alpha/beta hydrolase [Rubripirellula sp.]MDB4676780.1 alpha/beta hydrolase [bacterium]
MQVISGTLPFNTLRSLILIAITLGVTSKPETFCHAQEKSPNAISASENRLIWSDLAPGETTKESGNTLPSRKTDNPLITRVEAITQPTLDVFPAENPTGAAVLILPGGGFRYVVTDLEGSEAAKWLNDLGITAFVLRYRTNTSRDGAWKRPLQDSQRAMRLIRANSEKWNLKTDQIGLLGFSAGGQVAAVHLTSQKAAYRPADSIDQQRFQADFGILIYPWQIYDAENRQLISPIKVTQKTPPSFIVHTHDDGSTSLGAVFFYAALKQNQIAAELHVYQNGGHGYGTRQRPNSAIGSWKDRATEWLQINHQTHPSP